MVSQSTLAGSIADRILEYIRINRVSSTEVADALDKTGELDPGLNALSPGLRAVGYLHYVPAVSGSNWHTHQYIADTPDDAVVWVDATDCEGRAIFGSLVAKYAVLYRRAAGLVVSGAVRDAHILLKERYPIWCYGTTPIGCTNNRVDFDEVAYWERRAAYDGSILVADDSGVVIIRRHQLTEALLERLDFIEKQEDIWFDCIDRLKWNTFDTVCKKRYQQLVYPE
jgi:4-hydroxy-4-methyl-2-oxoglutarate aldolase